MVEYPPMLRADYTRGDFMAKKGMARPDWTHTQPRNDVSPVPVIQGKAKHGKERAKPVIPGTDGADLKVYHELKGDGSVGDPQ